MVIYTSRGNKSNTNTQKPLLSVAVVAVAVAIALLLLSCKTYRNKNSLASELSEFG